MGIDRRRLGTGYLPLREAIDQLFEGSFISPQSFGGQGTFPPVDLHATDDDVVLEMPVAGVNPDDINISITGDVVTISGEIKRRQRAEKHQALVEEVWKGRFQRSFQLPIPVDPNTADASFDNGVLVLRLPKSEATKPRKIQVRRQQDSIQQDDSSLRRGVEAEKVPIQQS